MMKIGYDRHMMVDIETLDTAATAVVLSVGAAVFNGYSILKTYHWTLRLKDQIEDGRTISADTLNWWMQQDPEVMRQAFGQGYLRWDVLEDLRNITKAMSVQTFWAHSPTFDYVILDHLFGKHERPWTHKSWLDTRTLAWLRGGEMKRGGGEHNAREDAVRQAQWVIETLGDK